MDKNEWWAVVTINSINMICWTVLAVVFSKWWVALFAALFFTTFSIKKHCRVCDKCGKHSPYAKDYNESLDKAKEAGWVHFVDGNKDYCPDCQ